MKLETRRATSFCKCAYCGETIRTAETFMQVTQDGKAVKGERYCDNDECMEAAYENNPGLNEPTTERDGEEHLRRMEDYAEYQYNGNTSAYWTDRDAGYAH